MCMCRGGFHFFFMLCSISSFVFVPLPPPHPLIFASLPCSMFPICFFPTDPDLGQLKSWPLFQQVWASSFSPLGVVWGLGFCVPLFFWLRDLVGTKLEMESWPETGLQAQVFITTPSLSPRCQESEKTLAGARRKPWLLPLRQTQCGRRPNK